MRLLHVSTFELESFVDEECPPYVILSHTWGKEEITFQEILKEGTIRQLKSAKICLSKDVVNSDQQYNQGCLKIVGCALRAHEKGFGYIWCDTCCIDKTNSTELSEAINSMYMWYKDRLCYVYLADVPSENLSAPDQIEHAFYSSSWFTRGWTLEELIAPANVIFFDAAWLRMGKKSQYRTLIAQRTGINEEVLAGDDPLRYSVATRMSWASRRQTTRVEDLAYCLMGLFGVNMPLIYGEKHKAFFRLQTETMRLTEDHSLLAGKTHEEIQGIRACGLLANSPADFADSGNVIPMGSRWFNTVQAPPPVSMTSRGVSIYFPLLQVNARQYTVPDRAALLFATLRCQDTNDNRGPLGIFLARYEDGSFRRFLSHRLNPAMDITDSVGEKTESTIYVTQQENNTRTLKARWRFSFHFAELPEELSQNGLILKVIANPENPSVSWDPEKRRLDMSNGLGAAIYVGAAAGSGKLLLLGIDSNLRTRCVLHSNAEQRVKYQDTDCKKPCVPHPHTEAEANFIIQYIRSDLAGFREWWSTTAKTNRWNTWKTSLCQLQSMESQPLLYFYLRHQNHWATIENQSGRSKGKKIWVKPTLKVLMTTHQRVQEGQNVNEVKFDKTD